MEELRKKCQYYKDKKLRLWNDRRSDRNSSRSKDKSFFQVFETERQKPIIRNNNKPTKCARLRAKPIDEDIECKGCHVSLPINAILKHLTKKKVCKELYSKTDYNCLQKKCKKHVEQVKNYRRNQLKITVYNNDTEENLSQDLDTEKFYGLRSYRDLKSKLQELHLNCFFAIDLEKLLHYKWEIYKINQKKNVFVMRRQKFEDLKNSLAQINITLENLVEDRIKEIKDTTTKWCFDVCDMDYVVRKLNASLAIKSKCQTLLCKVQYDFNTMLTDTLHSIREILYASGQEVTQLELKHVITISGAERTSKDRFIMNDIKELINKYVLS